VQLELGREQLLAKSGEQPADLVAGQRDHLVIVRVAVVRLGRGQDGQEGVREQGQDGPAVPGGPAADLVFVQGGEFLPAGEPVLTKCRWSTKWRCSAQAITGS
jgi:hypothetical protein